MDLGGFIRWNNPYRLRHLTTNTYLAIGSTPIWEISESVTYNLILALFYLGSKLEQIIDFGRV